MNPIGLTATKDFLFLQEAVENLEGYLLSPVMFFPITKVDAVSQKRIKAELTIGKLLLSFKRLQNDHLSATELNLLTEMQNKVENIRKTWQSNWLAKSANEFSIRLRLWTRWLQDWRGEGTPSLAIYQAQIFQRTILSLLTQQVGFSASSAAALEDLDKRLHVLTKPTSFIWESNLSTAFPTEVFWYLYREPKQ